MIFFPFWLEKTRCFPTLIRGDGGYVVRAQVSQPLLARIVGLLLKYCLKHRRPKLTMGGVFFFFNLYANVERAKRDTVTADIYYYIATEFGYAKRDLRLAVCGGVVLQRFEFIRVCMGKNGNRHYS